MKPEQLIRDVNWGYLDNEINVTRLREQLLILTSQREDDVDQDQIYIVQSIICHQSGLYKSTIAIVPVLLQLLQSPDLNAKSWIIGVLSCVHIDYVAVFDEMHYLHSTAKLLYQQMVQAIEEFVPYTVAERPFIRGSAAIILSRFVLDADRVIDLLLLRMIKEPDQITRYTVAEQVFTLVFYSKNLSSEKIKNVQTIMTILNKDEVLYIRVFAEIILLWLSNKTDIEQIAIYLVEDITKFKDDGDSYWQHLITTNLILILKTIESMETYNLLNSLAESANPFYIRERFILEKKRYSQRITNWGDTNTETNNGG